MSALRWLLFAERLWDPDAAGLAQQDLDPRPSTEARRARRQVASAVAEVERLIVPEEGGP